MKKETKLIWVLFLILLLGSSCTSTLDKKEFRIKQAIKRVVVIFDTVQNSQGTGTILSVDEQTIKILTNRHVCYNQYNEISKSLIVMTIYNTYKNVTNIKVNKHVADICLITITDNKLKKTFQVLPVLADENSQLGTYAFYMGFPKSRPSIFEGYATTPLNSVLQAFSLIVYSGASGSGVYNKHGELVGLVTTQLEGYPGFTGVTPVSLIKEFLNGIEK